MKDKRFEPAYRYGLAAAKDRRYEGWSWPEITPILKPFWEARHGHKSWDQFRQVIHNGFLKGRQA